MKTQIIALVSAVVLPLFAAENVPFTWFATNATGRTSGKVIISETNKIKLECNKDSKYGIGVQVLIPNVEDGTFYRLVLGMKTNESEYFLERFLQTGKRSWDIGALTAGELKTFYLIGNKAEKNNGWAISMNTKCSVELTQLSVEKLTLEEVKSNLIYKDGLVPGLWHGLWGKKQKEFSLPVLKQETASPNGEFLHFNDPGKDTGFPSMLPLPFIPNKEFECSIWLRSSGKGKFNMQFLNTNARKEFGFKNEWTEYKFKGKTNLEYAWNTLCFMITSSGNEIPAFDMGGITFRYITK